MPNSNISPLSEILSRVRITSVAEAHGVKIRRGRCVAPWRKDANGWNLALYDSTNRWIDFAHDERGGLLDFVSRVRGCDRRAALEWLAGFAGIPLKNWSNEERRDWGTKMRSAKPEAEALVRWKHENLEAFRLQRNRLMKIYHNARRFITNNDFAQCQTHGDHRFDLAASIAWVYWERVEELERIIDELEAASYKQLLVRFRGVAT
jgi:hypothetical protein